MIALDVDDPFAYTSCPSCQGGDWILRTKRNDEGSWNYWCVRCSRGFKTQFRLAHGRKPFVVVGAILTILIALPNLL